MKHFIFSLIFLFGFQLISAQNHFPEQCEGNWKGKMYMFKIGLVVDTIDVEMYVSPIPDTIGWTWKTVYKSTEHGDITKDYKIFHKTGTQNEYILDENNGILLYSYAFENKMYSNFEVQGSMLTSVYTLNDDKLIFEITSGKDIGKTGNDITNFSVMNVQRSVLRRVK